MGLLDSALKMFGNQNPLPMMDSKTQLLQAALSLLADNGRAGGLSGLTSRFQQAGLGNVISSWIGTGENAPITGTQIQQALGDQQLQQIFEEAGIPKDEAADQLSGMLPDLVDRMTPSGHIPEGGLGNMSALLDHFIGRQP